MEPNLSGNPNEAIKSRSPDQRAKQPIQTNAKPSSIPEAENFDYKRDPVYQNQDPASGSYTGSSPNLGDSFEGFKSSPRDAGMRNMQKTDGFGAQFQMPEPGENERYMGSSSAQSSMKPPVPQGEIPEAFVDIQTSIHAFQNIIQKLRDHLISPEQEDLENLLRQGSQLLSANWKQLSTVTTSQVSTLKEDIKENPYRGLIGALKIGMALSQIVMSRTAAATEGHHEVNLSESHVTH
ncbi:MAG: hypothetical protein H7249_04940 [Chitinophagaceae bacterium]|nr:hypothetical protein [Oligoflexus sp.]